VEKSWRTLGILGACRGVGVTHLAVWTANFLTGVQQRQTAVIEWNHHGDFASMGEFCKGKAAGNGSCRILEVDYFAQAGAKELADCLNGKYHSIIVDYGEITGQGLLDCARCDLKVIVGSLSEWQAEAFLKVAGEIEKRDKSWRFAAAFGSEEARKMMEKRFRISVRRIPDSLDVFAVTHADMSFFAELLRD
jgi:hypothetical protein